MANFQAQRPQPARPAPVLGKPQRLRADAPPAPFRIHEEFIEQGVAAAEFQAVSNGENQVTHRRAIRVDQPDAAVRRFGEQTVDGQARAILVVARRIPRVQLLHEFEQARNAGRRQRQECYSQVSMIREMARPIPRVLWIALPLAGLLYFFRLDAVGMLGPDEPRYASIAREMARSGDWVTPRLWGSPWFEKPPLLYWMSAVAFRLGLGPDLAPRLPVALMTAAFLAFYWWILNREFGRRPASLATFILGTCAGWFVFSQTGTPDLPLTATFSAAMLLALPWVARRDTRFLPLASALLGLAVLAKSLPPLALAAPLALRWRWWRDLLRWRVIAPFVVVAVPWHVLCYLRNGRAFIDTLFVEHQFGRFTSPALMHTQHWWFYLPVLAGLLLPWPPLVVLLARRAAYRDVRRLFLLLWVLFGLLLFTLSVNKLPGYVLPLAPALAALMALMLDEAHRARPWLIACALALVVFPAAAPILPEAVANGLLRAPRPSFDWKWLFPAAVAAGVWILEGRGKRLAATALVAVGAGVGMIYLKTAAAPGLNRVASARVLWREIADRSGEVCVDNIDRRWRYGLNYYSVTPLPECSEQARPLRVVQTGSAPPHVE